MILVIELRGGQHSDLDTVAKHAKYNTMYKCFHLIQCDSVLTHQLNF